MLIYAVIVTYNAMCWIDRCLMSLRESTIKAIPLIIDNNSKDQTVTYVRQKYPEAILFPQNNNLGFGRANNIGFIYAINNKAEYVLLLNQDAYISKNCLELLLKHSDKESLISPIHLNGNGSKIDYMVKCNTLLKANNLLLDDLILKKEKDLYEIGEICAACWLLPISILRNIGGFNPLFFHYGEDNNYYHRLVYHNIKSYCVPTAFMYHDREIHGDIKSYNKKEIYRKMLLIITNINLSPIDIAKKLFIILIECYYNLFRNKYLPGAFLYYLIIILFQIKSIYISRKKEIKSDSNWLK